MKPSYIGGYSEEYAEGHEISMEVAHPCYEISEKRLMHEVEDLATQLGETHSIHLHAVTEMREDAPDFPAFQVWTKVLNDYLYLSGLEEGLHPQELTRLPVLLREGEKAERVGTNGLNALPSKVTDIDERTYKFFAAGLRGNIYGPASEPGWRRVGIELRDTSRVLKKVGRNLQRVSNTLSRASWRGFSEIHADSPGVIFLRPYSESDAPIFRHSGIRPDMIERLSKAEPLFHVPLLQFEEARYMNYETGQWIHASAADRARIAESREKYMTSLRNLQAEIDRMDRSGDRPDAELIRMGIRMNLSEWAKKAEVSRLWSMF